MSSIQCGILTWIQRVRPNLWIFFVSRVVDCPRHNFRFRFLPPTRNRKWTHSPPLYFLYSDSGKVFKAERWRNWILAQKGSRHNFVGSKERIQICLGCSSIPSFPFHSFLSPASSDDFPQMLAIPLLWAKFIPFSLAFLLGWLSNNKAFPAYIYKSRRSSNPTIHPVKSSTSSII